MIVIFYYYPSERKRERARERERKREKERGTRREDRRTDDLRGTHGRRFGITEDEGGESEKRGFLADDKEREKEEEKKGKER